MRKDRRLAMLLACILAAAVLFAVFFIVLEADHDCCGEDCAVCAVLSVCEEALRRLVGQGLSVMPAMLFAIVVLRAIGAAVTRFDCCTLITLKVKLSD